MRLFRTVCIAVTFCLATAVFSPMVTAGDGERGERLYENHCTACHTSIAHKREGRKAYSKESLRDWVKRWQEHLALGWSDADIDDVATFLDERYYNFK